MERPHHPTNNHSSQRIQHPGVASMSGIRVSSVPPQIRSRTPPPGLQPVPPRMPPGTHMGGLTASLGVPNQHHLFPNNWQNGIRQNGK